MFDLRKRVALVTGAGRGIGGGIARGLARQGAAVAVNDLHRERADTTAEAIRAQGGSALAVPFDVTDADAVSAGVARVETALGPVDVLVNNAGVPENMGIAPFRDMDAAEWRKYIDLNLYGVLHCTKRVIDGMCERGFGRVITISSGAGQIGVRLGISLYGAGKGGAIAFMRHLAVEVARNGVTVNTVALGLMANTADATATAALARSIPIGRLGTPEDVGAAVVYLASDEASWMTGQTLGLNGGTVF
jgi:3-oxoacyl-[acyl-carrier protein] reductase